MSRLLGEKRARTVLESDPHRQHNREGEVQPEPECASRCRFDAGGAGKEVRMLRRPYWRPEVVAAGMCGAGLGQERLALVGPAAEPIQETWSAGVLDYRRVSVAFPFAAVVDRT